VTVLCIAVAGAVLATVPVPDGSFTLAWRHSVEKTWWREDYRFEADGRLRLVRASVEGSGAGMDPPASARPEGTAWVWSPDMVLPELRLAGSGFGGDYELCTASEGCRPLLPRHAVPDGGGGVTLAECNG